MNMVFSLASNPIVQIILILLIAIVLIFINKRRAGLFVLIALGAWLWLIGCTPFTQKLVAGLEQKYLPIKVDTILVNEVNVLVLGAGHSDASRQSNLGKLVNVSVNRLAEGVRIHNALRGSKLVLSGKGYGGRSQAEIAALAAIELGVGENDTLQIRSPGNTKEEIEDYIDRFGKKKQVILVTSAVHMHRAMLICQKFGLNAVPAPTDYYFKAIDEQSGFNYVPSAQKVFLLQIFLHEWGGELSIKYSL